MAFVEGLHIKVKDHKGWQSPPETKKGQGSLTEYGPTDTLSSDFQIQYFKIVDFCYYK